ncbi:MAG: hypothetical protein FWG80_03815 [Alphaproteobacteria bacterium]|nr:hypothetical protein [Alphaproteobacteria bacterium]
MKKLIIRLSFLLALASGVFVIWNYISGNQAYFSDKFPGAEQLYEKTSEYIKDKYKSIIARNRREKVYEIENTNEQIIFATCSISDEGIDIPEDESGGKCWCKYDESGDWMFLRDYGLPEDCMADCENYCVGKA